MRRNIFFASTLMFMFLGFASCEPSELENSSVETQQEVEPLNPDLNVTTHTDSGVEGHSDLGDDD